MSDEKPKIIKGFKFGKNGKIEKKKEEFDLSKDKLNEQLLTHPMQNFVFIQPNPEKMTYTMRSKYEAAKESIKVSET